MKKLLFSILICLGVLQVSAQPVVSSFSPVRGTVGTSITITGSNFSSTASANIVYIGGVKAVVTAATTTSITATVQAGAMYLPVSVTTNNLTAYSTQPFIITFNGASPSFTPGSFGYAGVADSVISGIETTKYTVADIDNDGLPDVITVDRLSSNFSSYRNITTAGVVSFAAPLNITTSASPRAVAAADMDGDGKSDVIVTNLTANTVSVFRNITTGATVSFAPKVDFATATQPSGIAVADLDKDGRPDLIINTINSNGYVSVLRNNSSGSSISFDPKTDLQSTGGSIESIAAGDMDGDGSVDICVPNYTLNSVSIFRNTTTGSALSFAAKVDVATNQFPYQIAIGDLNADGKPDMVITYYLTNNVVSVYRNTSTSGSISFSSTGGYSIGNNPDDVTINDLDGDGKPDLAVCSGLDSVALFKNTSAANGAISFAARAKFASPWNSPIITADFDVDGKPDIALRSGIFRVTIWKNKTDEPYIASFTPLNAGPGMTVTITGVNLTGATAVSFGGVAASGFTVINDNTITATIATGASGTVIVTTPKGTASLTGFTFYPAPGISSFTPTTGSNGTTVTISGSNFTGTTTVRFGGVAAASFTIVSPTTITAVVAGGASGTVSVVTPGGTVTINGFIYVPPPVIGSFTPTSAGPGAIITINGSNLVNVSTVRFGNTAAASFTVNSPTQITAIVGAGSSGTVAVATPYGTATLAGFVYLPPVPPVITSLSPSSGPVGTTVIINGSHFNTNASGNIVYFGATRANVVSATATGLTVTVPAGATYQPVSVYNKANYVTGYSASPFLVTFAGTNAAFTPFSFDAGQEFATGFIAGYTSLSDLDGDGRADVIYGDAAKGVTILRNISTPGLVSFAPKMTINAVSDPFFGVLAEDIDGDGRPDLVAMEKHSSVAGPGQFAVLINTSNPGNVSFAQLVEFPSGAGIRSIAIADFDKDGRGDVIVSNFGDKNVSVFRNTSTPGQVAFAPLLNLSTSLSPGNICTGDFDGDGKIDFAVRCDGQNNLISIYKNTSMGTGLVAFVAQPDVVLANLSSGYIASADLNADGKRDLVATSSYNTSLISVFKNTSAGGTITFGDKSDYAPIPNPLLIAFGDLNGDGKPDMAVGGGYANSVVSLYRNVSAANGSILFDPKVTYSQPFNSYFGLALGDIDGDHKPDITTANQQSKITVFRNRADSMVAVAVCVNAAVSIPSDASGGSYQWQVNTGTGFTNISTGNTAYTGATTSTLGIVNTTLPQSNYQYRCIVGPLTSKTYVLLVKQSPPSLLTISSSGPTNLCTGGSVALTADTTNCSSCNYTWNTGTNGISQLVNATGNYVVTATNGCGTASGSQQVTMSSPPTITIAAGTNPLCMGSSTQLTASGATTYTWTSAVGLGSTTGAVVTVSPIAATTTYIVTGMTNGCSASQSIAINVNAPLVPTVAISLVNCDFTTAAFNASITNGGPAPTVEWFVNGLLAGSGTSFILTNATNGAEVYAQLTSFAKCVSPQTATSSIIKVNCIPTVSPPIDELETFELGPNPTTGLLVAKLKFNSRKKLSFEVTDALGKTVYLADAGSVIGIATKEIDLRGKSPGVYFLKTVVNGKAMYQKILLR